MPTQQNLGSKRVVLLLSTFATLGACTNTVEGPPPVVPAPTITSFSSSLSSVQMGGTTTLSWATTNADRLKLLPLNQDVTKLSSIQVTVMGDTTFRLEATNAGPTVATAEKLVTATPPPPPDGGHPLDAGTPPPSALVYVDPPAGGKVRLVKDASTSTSTQVVLKLVSNASLSGYSIGFDLPLAEGRVSAGSPLATFATEALNPGGPPQAIGAAIPTSGPLAGVLVIGMSQKAAGNGAVPNDAQIAPGKLFYSVKLGLAAGAPLGVVFNGGAPGSRFRASLRDKLGNEVVSQGDFAIGTLSVQ